MTALELTGLLLRTFGIVFFYFLIGFGPGTVIGMILANKVYAKGQVTHMQSQRADITRANKHNAQWDPNHPRWNN